MHTLLEICVDSYASAMAAVRAVQKRHTAEPWRS